MRRNGSVVLGRLVVFRQLHPSRCGPTSCPSTSCSPGRPLQPQPSPHHRVLQRRLAESRPKPTSKPRRQPSSDWKDSTHLLPEGDPLLPLSAPPDLPKPITTFTHPQARATTLAQCTMPRTRAEHSGASESGGPWPKLEKVHRTKPATPGGGGES